MQTPQRGSPLVDGDRHHAQGGAPIGPRGETHPATARAQLSALFAWEETRARSSPPSSRACLSGILGFEKEDQYFPPPLATHKKIDQMTLATDKLMSQSCQIKQGMAISPVLFDRKSYMIMERMYNKQLE